MDPHPPMASHLRSEAKRNSVKHEHPSKPKRPPLTHEERHSSSQTRSERIAQRRATAREKLKEAAQHYKPNRKDMELVEEEELNDMYQKTVRTDPELKEEGHSWMRNLWGSSTSHYVEYPYQSSWLADDAEYYGTTFACFLNV